MWSMLGEYYDCLVAVYTPRESVFIGFHISVPCTQAVQLLSLCVS